MAEEERRPAWQMTDATWLAGRAALDGVDALAIEFERKWGVGRLRLLVDPDLRERFDRQRLMLNTANWHGGLEDVRREAGRMANAWRALDRAATAAGAPELAPEVWEVALPNGRVAAIARNVESAWFATYRKTLDGDDRRVTVYTLDEVANLLEGFPTLAKAKEEFPGAEVTRVWPITDPLDGWQEKPGDEIPF